jgi:hypothetical protein
MAVFYEQRCMAVSYQQRCMAVSHQQRCMAVSYKQLCIFFPFIVAPSTVDSSHRQLASAEITHENWHAQEHGRRSTLYVVTETRLGSQFYTRN